MDNIILKNEFVRVELGNDCIQWYDLKDKYNDYQGFTQNKIGISKAIEFVKQIANDERLKDSVTMGNVTDLMDKFKLRPHTFCGMD